MANNPAIRLPVSAQTILTSDLDLNGHNIDFPTTPNISDCLDEDNMASNSATKLATQQSIKAYVDNATPTAHHDSHDPEDGSDALDCAAAAEISVVVAASEGTAHSFARSDHVHAINHAITDNHILTVDGTINSGEYLKATANGAEGKTLAEMLGDLSGDAGATFSWNDQILSAVKGTLNTAESELTIDGAGAITVTQMRHKVDTAADAASDELVTINGGGTVNLIILRAEADARTVVVKHNTGNIWLQGKADISLDDLEDGIMLAWDSTNSKWFDIAAGGGGGGADADAIHDNVAGEIVAVTEKTAPVGADEFLIEDSADTNAKKSLKFSNTPLSILKNTVTTKTGVATLTVAEAGVILVSAAGAAYTITLPTAVGNTGLTYRFIKTDNNYTLITIDGDGAETFNYENSAGAAQTTYPRLNTYCAEVTVVSDGTNWQCLNEQMGLIPKAWAYLGTNDMESMRDSAPCRVDFNTEVYDTGSNFDMSTWDTGVADTNTVNHLISAGGAFVAGMVYSRVKNTTDVTEAWVTAVNSPTDLTLSADIFPDGNGSETYLILKSEFVAPVSGRYRLTAGIVFTNLVAAKGYQLHVMKNYTSVYVLICYEQSSLDSYLTASGTIEVSLAADDVITVSGYQASGGTNVDMYAGLDGHTFIQAALVGKD